MSVVQADRRPCGPAISRVIRDKKKAAPKDAEAARLVQNGLKGFVGGEASLVGCSFQFPGTIQGVAIVFVRRKILCDDLDHTGVGHEFGFANNYVALRLSLGFADADLHALPFFR
jgi:hypothetical protein